MVRGRAQESLGERRLDISCWYSRQDALAIIDYFIWYWVLLKKRHEECRLVLLVVSLLLTSSQAGSGSFILLFKFIYRPACLIHWSRPRTSGPNCSPSRARFPASGTLITTTTSTAQKSIWPNPMSSSGVRCPSSSPSRTTRIRTRARVPIYSSRASRPINCRLKLLPAEWKSIIPQHPRTQPSLTHQ